MKIEVSHGEYTWDYNKFTQVITLWVFGQGEIEICCSLDDVSELYDKLKEGLDF